MAMAAAEDGEAVEAFDVATWRIVTLFLLILFVDTIIEFVDELVSHHLRRNPESVHAFTQLKFETMALGVVSLLLVVFEELLLKICIDSPDKDKHGSEYDKSEVLEADEAHRRLLAGGGGNPCPEGKESLWGADLIHKAHILIFLIAACHLIWALLSTVLSMLALRKWHKFEANVQGRGLLPMPLGGLQRHGEPTIVYGLRHCLRQFTHPVDEAQYGAIRALFIHFTKSEETFDFAGFLSGTLAAEFASVVKFDVFMWGLVCVWVSFPEGTYGGLWMTGLCIVVSLVVGAKLHVVAMHLARHAYSRFYKPYGSGKLSKLPIKRISENGHDANPASKVAAGAVAEGQEADEAEATGAPEIDVEVSATSSSRKPLRRLVRGHSQRIKGTGESENLRKLFWFGTPRHMLRVFRYVFFQSALGVAALIFRFWQNEDNFLGGAVSNINNTVRAVGWGLFLLVVLVLVHISMYLLPVYALTGAVASCSCIAGVLEYAKAKNIRPDLVEYLERTAARKDDDESDDEEVLHVVAPCTDESACEPTEETSSQQQSAAADSKPASFKLSDLGGSLQAKEGSIMDGTAASSTSPTDSVAVTGGMLPASNVEPQVDAALGVRAASEMPTSGGDGGGEVDWFNQLEREEAQSVRPAVVTASSLTSVQQGYLQDDDVPVKEAAVVAQREAMGSAQTPQDPASSQMHVPVGVLAAAEMPLSGVGGDAAVDWLEKKEREQGEGEPQDAAVMRRRGSSVQALARFRHASSGAIPRASLTRGGSQASKDFASVMLGPRALSSVPRGSDASAMGLRGSAHASTTEENNAHASGHHEHLEVRPPTITETISSLLESMATQRHAELTRRLTVHRVA